MGIECLICCDKIEKVPPHQQAGGGRDPPPPQQTQAQQVPSSSNDLVEGEGQRSPSSSSYSAIEAPEGLKGHQGHDHGLDQSGSHILSTPCGHIFHLYCLHRWLSYDDRRCPSCRKLVQLSSCLSLFPSTEGGDSSNSDWGQFLNREDLINALISRNSQLELEVEDSLKNFGKLYGKVNNEKEYWFGEANQMEEKLGKLEEKATKTRIRLEDKIKSANDRVDAIKVLNLKKEIKLNQLMKELTDLETKLKKGEEKREKEKKLNKKEQLKLQQDFKDLEDIRQIQVAQWAKLYFRVFERFLEKEDKVEALEKEKEELKEEVKYWKERCRFF